MASSLVGVQHIHVTLKMASKEYTAQTGYAFVPPHKPGDYPPTTRSAEEKVIVTEKFQQNQALFSK